MCKELEDWLHEEKTTGIAEGRAAGKAEGKAEGKVEGRAKGKLEDALEMLKDGIPFEKIAKYTKLSMQSIENLAKQHKLA